MKEGSRSGNLPGRVERSSGPFGCLIVKKKGHEFSNGVSSGKQKSIETKERKRPRLIISDSESDEDLIVPRPNVICRDGASSLVRSSIPDYFEPQKEIEIIRKRKSESVVYTDGARIDRNKFLEPGMERKRGRTEDVGYSKDGKYDRLLLKDKVEERRTEIGRNGVLISKARAPVVKQRDSKADSSRSLPVDNGGHFEYDRTRNFSAEQERKSVGTDRQRFEKKIDGNIRPSSLRENFEVPHSKPIRVQGKNGVLKVMPSNKNKVGGSERFFSPKKEEAENQKVSGPADYCNGKTVLSPSFYSDSNSHEKPHSIVVSKKKGVNSLKKLSIEHNEAHDRRQRVTESSQSEESKTKGVGACSSKKEVSNKKQKILKSEPCESKDVGASTSKKVVSNKKQEPLATEPCLPTKRKEGEVKRGSGTEKQLIREQIREMLVNAGWTIDLRPRRNRDYRDSVYINPSGTEYWSITKAYYAFQKHVEDDGKDQNHSGSFNLIPEDELSKLTRKTQKKMEREIRMQQKADRGSKNANPEKKLKREHVKVKTDSGMSEEGMQSYVLPDDNPLKMRIKGNSVAGPFTADLSKSKKSSMSKALCGNKENKKQSGRALLVRNSSKGPNMDGDDYIPYTGKRTVLSWLIDMETVPMSGKVQYMNKKRSRAMLEGWITRDGIHCRCCSKILTISKFELHAGSKLHQPFQNIILENGVSLYQCQLDAWNKQDKSARVGFHFIDVDGDDPNDDTCGICGDGGDLICCDGCPSTFHQTCLDIQMLPSGDWLCPNCSCKFCGVDETTVQEEEMTLNSCIMCEEKYHRQCRRQADGTSVDSDSSSNSFCGKTCEEIFQQLQKLLGVKHELQAGFSWTLIQRSNLDSDASSRGQCQKAECNSKIAVALTVMDECFLPVIDQRSGVHLIHNVLYNIGSNFNRLNYSGFYTAVLERGDEIIAAASIRIHGTRLAEMPFIGTRHIYRRQGMCRRLFNAIESALRSLNVEKLVIPAVSELLHTWTTVFGFKPLEESHKKEVKSLNMLVFPSTDLLQKPLLNYKFNEVDVTESSAFKATKPDGFNQNRPEMNDNIDMGSVEPDTCAPDNSVVDREVNNGFSSIETDRRGPSGSTYDTSDTINNPSCAFHESLASVGTGLQDPGGSTHDTSDVTSNSLDAALGSLPDGPSEESAPDTKFLLHQVVDHDIKNHVESKPIYGSPVESKLQNCSVHLANEVKVKAFGVELDHHPYNDTSVQGNADDKCANGRLTGESRTGEDQAQINSDLTKHNVQKVECKFEKDLIELHSCACERSIVYDYEAGDGAASIGCGISGPNGSVCDTSYMTGNPSYVALRPAFGAPNDECALESGILLPCANHDSKTDVKTELSVDPKLKSSTEDDVLKGNVKAASHDHIITNSSYLNAISNICQLSDKNPVGRSSDLNEINVHNFGCPSVEVCRVVSDANALSTSEKSTKQDVGEVKTDSSAVASCLYSFDECSAPNELPVVTPKDSSQRRENIVCYDSKGTDPDYIQNAGGDLVHHHDTLPNVQDGSYNATGAMDGTCQVGNDIASDNHGSKELGNDSVDCTSEVIG